MGSLWNKIATQAFIAIIPELSLTGSRLWYQILAPTPGSKELGNKHVMLGPSTEYHILGIKVSGAKSLGLGTWYQHLA